MSSRNVSLRRIFADWWMVALLVTCGSMSQAELRGDIVSIVSEPLRDAGAGINLGGIQVLYGDAVVWFLAAEECQTWFVRVKTSTRKTAI